MLDFLSAWARLLGSLPLRSLLCVCFALAGCGGVSTGRRYAASTASQTRLACIGDSITYGASLPDREHTAYPSQLSRLLGGGWGVRNFGDIGTTMLRNGNAPYIMGAQAQQALASAPDVVVILLGTNDAKPFNWVHKDEFAADTGYLIDRFAVLPTRPRIYVCLPIPVFSPGNFGIDGNILRTEITPILEQVAHDKGVGIIDLYTPFIGRAGLVPDRVHPNAEGARLIAQTVCDALKK